MWTKKNTQLLVIAGLLLVANIVIAFTQGSGKKKLAVESDYFKWNNQLSAIEINNRGEKIRITLERGQWILNDELLAQEDFANLIEAIFKEVEVRRAVPKNLTEEIKAQFDEKGVEVNLTSMEGEIYSLQVYGDAAANISYFRKKGEEPFVVYIPGYTSFLAGIFGLQTEQWKSKLALSSEPESLVSWILEDLENPERKISIQIKGIGLEAIGLEEEEMEDYMDILSSFKIDAYPESDKLGYYQSLISGPTFATIHIETINKYQKQQVNLFKTTEQGLILAESDRYGWMLFNQRNIQRLLK
jgi:hypothetical protein